MENQKTQNQNKGWVYYMRKYGNYITLCSVTFIVILAIVISVIAGNGVQETEPVSNSTVITFQSPVANGQIAMGYNATELQYNKALNIWQIHKGVDYVAEIGTDVLCAYDGTVANISTDILNGTVIEVDHGNGLKTTYGSLDSKTSVKVGDAVQKGDLLGKASNSATAETAEQGEVHFEVWKDGNLVDPANYLDLTGGK